MQSWEARQPNWRLIPFSTRKNDIFGREKRTSSLQDKGVSKWIVEDQVLDQGAYYFRNIVNSAPENAQSVLAALAELNLPESGSQIPKPDRPTQRWLKRRGLLTEDDRLTIPVLADWMREYWM